LKPKLKETPSPLSQNLKKMTTTTVYKLYTYSEAPAAGLPLRCDTQEFSTLKEAQIAGRRANATFYEIQVISTTREPPTKKNPEGSISTSTTMVERKSFRQSQWAMKSPSPTGLRIQCGINGYFQIKMDDEDALRAAVALRGLGLGLCWRPGRQMITAKVSNMDKVEKTLVSMGLLRSLKVASLPASAKGIN
jgi:hypothetical protein